MTFSIHDVRLSAMHRSRGVLALEVDCGFQALDSTCQAFQHHPWSESFGGSTAESSSVALGALEV